MLPDHLRFTVRLSEHGFRIQNPEITFTMGPMSEMADLVARTLNALVDGTVVLRAEAPDPMLSVHYWNTETGGTGTDRVQLSELPDFIGDNPYIIHQVNKLGESASLSVTRPPAPVTWTVTFATSSSAPEQFEQIIREAVMFAQRNGMRPSQIASHLSGEALKYQDR